MLLIASGGREEGAFQTVEKTSEKFSQGAFKHLVLSTLQVHFPTLITEGVYLEGETVGS